MAPQLTPVERLTIVSLHESGYSVSAIQKKTGVARKTIYFWLKRNKETGGNLSAHHRQDYERSTTAQQDKAIVEVHNEQPQMTMKEIAKLFNVSADTVRRRINESKCRHSRQVKQKARSLKVPKKEKVPKNVNYNLITPKYPFSQDVEAKYTDLQKDKILKVINDSDFVTLTKYDVTKPRLRNFTEWRNKNGTINSLSEVEAMQSFNRKYATKFFDSILKDVTMPMKEERPFSLAKIKGQILNPSLSEVLRSRCRTVLAVYVTLNSVCWTLIEKYNYEVLRWQYFPIDYQDGKRCQISEIYEIARRVVSQLPLSDIYVLRSEATAIRAGGGGGNAPLSLNLQKSQLVCMIVALLNSRTNNYVYEDPMSQENIHKVYFLRSSLPFRLYGTLIGNEKVSTDQTIEMILQNANIRTNDGSKMYMAEELKYAYRSQNELQKDMLGHSLLLAMTFMDLCIYKNDQRINSFMMNSEH